MLIEDLNLSLRTYNCLKRKGIDTVEQMMEMTDEELLCIRGFGAVCLREVRTTRFLPWTYRSADQAGGKPMRKHNPKRIRYFEKCRHCGGDIQPGSPWGGYCCSYCRIMGGTRNGRE